MHVFVLQIFIKHAEIFLQRKKNYQLKNIIPTL